MGVDGGFVRHLVGSSVWIAALPLAAVGCGGGSLDPIVLDEPFAHVVVHVDGGSVSITGSPDDRAEVYRVIEKGKSKSQLGWDLVDGTLYLDAICHKKNPTNCQVDHDLVLPSGVAIDAWVGGGAVHLTAFDGAVNIGLGEGEVYGSYVESDAVSVTAGEGDVVLEFAAAPSDVSVGVGTGSIELMVPQGYYDATFEAAIGSVDMVGIIQDADAPDVLQGVVGQGDVIAVGY